MLVSVDGYMGYILPISSIVFSLDKVVKKGCRPVVEVIKEENELTLTPDLRLDSEFGRKKVLRRLKGRGGDGMKQADIMDAFMDALDKTIFSAWRHEGFIGGFTSSKANFEIDGKEYVLALREVGNGEHWSEV